MCIYALYARAYPRNGSVLYIRNSRGLASVHYQRHSRHIWILFFLYTIHTQSCAYGCRLYNSDASRKTRSKSTISSRSRGAATSVLDIRGEMLMMITASGGRGWLMWIFHLVGHWSWLLFLNKRGDREIETKNLCLVEVFGVKSEYDCVLGSSRQSDENLSPNFTLLCYFWSLLVDCVCIRARNKWLTLLFVYIRILCCCLLFTRCRKEFVASFGHPFWMGLVMFFSCLIRHHTVLYLVLCKTPSVADKAFMYMRE